MLFGKKIGQGVGTCLGVLLFGRGCPEDPLFVKYILLFGRGSPHAPPFANHVLQLGETLQSAFCGVLQKEGHGEILCQVPPIPGVR